MTATEEWSALLYRLLLFTVTHMRTRRAYALQSRPLTGLRLLMCKYNAHAAKFETAVNSNQSTKEKT